ncbi:EspA/EspE family type VII secretion system effector [Mycolicibacterium houstonense]|uniref:EspA/EspE family type VII secretion system effector n=1 Tax=Mycolicibacterium houstonense TaxID=146021 RepID=UPI000AE30ED2|nr:EspA/EspE family type VII secretion system effector [Mycolicibacterium houstonense]
MSVGAFYYLQGNYAYGIADHANGAKSSVPWAMAGIGTDLMSMGQLVATEGAQLMAKSAAASGAASSAESLKSFAKGAGTPIINAGLVALTLESNMLGFGRPEDGERFTRGADQFMSANASLLQSAPPDDWTGDASNAYGDRNKEQQARTADMYSKDMAIQKVLAEEAGQVDNTREFVSKRQTILSAAIAPALAAKLIPYGGQVISTMIEIAAVSGTVPFATQRVSLMTEHAGEHARTIRGITSEYQSIASNAEMPGGGFGPA